MKPLFGSLILCACLLAVAPYCDLVEGSGDRWPCNVPTPCDNDTYYGDPVNCTNFYQCGPGGWVIYRKQCPRGTLWDKSSGQCVQENSAPTCEAPCATTSPADNVTDLPTGACDWIPSPCEECKIYPDRETCSKFWQCQNSTLLGRACLPGRVYDPELRKCKVGDHASCTPQCPTRPPTTPEPTPTTPEPTPTTPEPTPTTAEPAPTTLEPAPTTDGSAPTTPEEAPTTDEPAPTTAKAVASSLPNSLTITHRTSDQQETVTVCTHSGRQIVTSATQPTSEVITSYSVKDTQTSGLNYKDFGAALGVITAAIFLLLIIAVFAYCRLESHRHKEMVVWTAEHEKHAPFSETEATDPV